MNKTANRLNVKKERHCVVPLFFSFLFFFSACQKNSTDENVARFSYEQCYQLGENEKVINRDSTVLKKYEQWSNYGKYHLPLNLVIENPDYRTYVGILMEGKLENFAEFLKSYETHNYLDSKESRKGWVLLMKSEEDYAMRYLFEEKEFEQSIVINFVSKDSTIINELFRKADSLLEAKLTCD